jgi:hypothetical protein
MATVFTQPLTEVNTVRYSSGNVQPASKADDWTVSYEPIV